MKLNTEHQNVDVIVVYSQPNAHNAREKQYLEKAPFPEKGRRGSYNDSYQYLLDSCKKKGLKAAFTTSGAIIGPGLFLSYWTYQNKWIRNAGKIFSEVLFDKFTPGSINKKRKLELLTSSENIYTFNKKIIKNLFQDKLNTYSTFKEFAIPTVEVKVPTKDSLLLAKRTLNTLLSQHPNSSDFGDEYILKDRTGAGGNRIHKINFKHCDFTQIMDQHKKDKKEKELISYILQPFIDCKKGFIFSKYQGFIDLRVIILNKKIVQSYIRIAKKGEYKCNEHQGGNLVYIPTETIPKDAVIMSKKIMKTMEQHVNLSHTLYALDFIRSNNGNLYFIEGNSNPGIDWDHTKKSNELESKKFIDLIAEELVNIVKEKRAHITK